MTQVEELTLNLADDALTEAQARQLQELLAADTDAHRAHIRILQIEAGLRAQKKNPELAARIMARLRSHLAESVAQGIMTQIRTQPAPEWARERGLEADLAPPSSRILLLPSRAGGPGWTAKQAWLAVAACLTLVAGVGFWYFGPTMGEPVLAEIHGADLSLERAGHLLPAVAGLPLQTGDALRTRTNGVAVIGFAPENTRLTLKPGTELTLTGLSRGKRFDLRTGKLEASVARQRPFFPMRLTTPQAEARVVGTRFTLLVTSSATRLDVTEGKVQMTRLADAAAVKVGAGRYAIVGNQVELSALPFTGGILREWWSGVTNQTVLGNPRFWDHPGRSDMARTFELEPVKTNRVFVRFRGYLHPPVTGDYEFWLAGATASTLFMSPSQNRADKIKIAFSGGAVLPRDWDHPQVFANGGTQRSTPIPMVAGKRYYVEAILFVEKGEGHLSVAWKRPGASRELLTGEFLSPFKPE